LSVKKNKIAAADSSEIKKTVDPGSLALLTLQARNLLAFHDQIGLSCYPATTSLRLFAARTRPVPKKVKVTRTTRQQTVPTRGQRPASAASTSPAVSRPARNRPPASRQPVSLKTATASLETIAGTVADCHHCPDVSGRPPRLPALANSLPRLFVAADCFIGSDAANGMLWGSGEDTLFWKMMAAIGLNPDSVYVSNCVKCCQPAALPPGSDTEQHCFSFLEQELLAIQPSLICAMGEMATRLLLRSQTPLVRLRGRFHPYRYPDGSRGLVMPTFHPRFLLEHEEMKRATWEDLQAIQHRLAVAAG
jgi:DNA polymerase